MRILITGGAGFIGSHLAKYHIEKNDSVWAIDNLSTGRKENILPLLNHPAFIFSEANLLDWNRLEEAVAWAEGIYHMAAIVGQKIVITKPATVLSENIAGFELLLQMIIFLKKENQRIVLASSSEVYGMEGTSSFREDAQISFPSEECVQISYALSKFVNEVTAISYIQQKNLNCVIARLFNTSGPNQTGRYGMVIPRFIDQALANQPITVYGTGNQSRSFCDVRDTVSLLEQLLKNERAKGEIFNVGNDREISILDLALLIKNLTKSNSKIAHISYSDAYGIDYKDTVRRCPNLEKTRAFFHFNPKWSLETTIQAIADARRQNEL
jgi:UDP-glucose 4-epimerase